MRSTNSRTAASSSPTLPRALEHRAGKVYGTKGTDKQPGRRGGAPMPPPRTPRMSELIPEVLVRDLVVELDLLALDARPERLGAALGGGELQLRVLLVYLGAEQLLGVLARLEEPDRVVDVVRQEARAVLLVLVVEVAERALEPGLEDREDRQVGVDVGRDRADLDAGRALVADRDADHRAAVLGRDLDLVRRLEVRVEAAVRVDARVEDQADVVGVRQDPVQEAPGEARQAVLALLVVEGVLALLRDRHVGVAAVAVDVLHRLGQEGRGHVHLR